MYLKTNVSCCASVFHATKDLPQRMCVCLYQSRKIAMDGRKKSSDFFCTSLEFSTCFIGKTSVNLIMEI